MLSYLRVRGLALLDDVALNFEPGMNVLTGETGAGKSIIVGALSLLRGVRGRSELVRDGADSAVVDAQFEPTAASVQRMGGLLETHGLPHDSADALVVQRQLPRGGRGRCFVQGALTTQHVLGAFGESLIDICSQHEHHFLTHTARHLDVLDAYADNDALLDEYVVAHGKWRESEASLAALQDRVVDAQGRADYLRFQIEELDRVAPEPGEFERLRKKIALMKHAHRWLEFARQTHSALYERDDAIASELGSLAEQARAGADDSDALSDIHEQLVTARVATEEAASAALALAEELELDPRELEEADDRLHALEGLRRKHGVDVDALVDRAEQMRVELAELDNVDDHLEALRARTQELHQAAKLLAGKLTKRRQAAAAGLADAVESELAALHIPAARIEVETRVRPDLGPTGSDEVEFMFSANAGESVAALRKVASGGELSRVLLALKGVLAAGDRIATYVFDEVDAGVGGAVAEAIGQRLKRAASAHQVLCITHLPQIAAFADAHFRVQKRARKGRTVTEVVRLDDAERVEELARMLGGKRVTKSARDHAQQLLSAARPKRSRRGARAR